MKRFRRLFLILCVMIFVIVLPTSSVGCAPCDPGGYEYIEFSFSEMKKLPDFAQKILEPDDELGWRAKFFINDTDLDSFFLEYVGKDRYDYIASPLEEDDIVIVFARYGFGKCNYRYSNFWAYSEKSIERTILDPNSRVQKDYWLDVVIIPAGEYQGGYTMFVAQMWVDMEERIGE